VHPRCQWGWQSYVRKTGTYEREKQPLGKKLKLIFLFNPLTEWIDTTHLMRLYLHDKSIKKGRKEGERESTRQIAKFVGDYEINMDDFTPSDTSQYTSFEDFFTRKHKPGSRPIDTPEDASRAVCVADSRVVAYELVSEAKKLWIKGQDFSITNLTMDTDLGEQYAGASVASFRLSPQDYHRYHSPVTGCIKLFRSIPGDYYQVDAIALRSDVDILTRNKRELVVIETEELGNVLVVAIGATDVGSVVIHQKYHQPGQGIKKGDELGIFQFGGSSIVVAFEKGRIGFDQDIIKMSKKKIQVAVEVGMCLGSAVSSSARVISSTGDKSYAAAVKEDKVD